VSGENREETTGIPMEPLPWTEEDGEMADGGHSWRPARAPKDGSSSVLQTSWRGLIYPEDGGRVEPAIVALWPAAVLALAGSAM
jgi:hypothetical protein